MSSTSTTVRPSSPSPTFSISLASAFISSLGLTVSVLAYAVQCCMPGWKRELPLREIVPASRYHRRSFGSISSDASSSVTLTSTQKRPKQLRHVSFGTNCVISFPEESSPSELATPCPKSRTRPSCLRRNSTPVVGCDSPFLDCISEFSSGRSIRSSFPTTNPPRSEGRSNSVSITGPSSWCGPFLPEVPHLSSVKSLKMSKRARAATDHSFPGGRRTPSSPSCSGPYLKPSNGVPVSRSTPAISESYSVTFDPFRPFKSKTRPTTPGTMTPSPSTRRVSVPFTNPWTPEAGTTPTRTRATFSGLVYETPGTITPLAAPTEQVITRCRLASEHTVRYLTKELDRRLLRLQEQKIQHDASRERSRSKLARKLKHIQKNLQASIPAGILSR